ncbi:MAG: hypothetical protein MJ193_00290, partial [Clostridia bacterium]|nr:hypothetical protein [Clostridia bacterium]
MKKSILSVCIIVLVLTLALFAFTACNTSEIAYGDELVTNGKLSSFTDSKFDGWKVRKDWDSSTQFGKAPVEQDNYCLYLENVQSGCSYLYQEIKVDRKATYKVSVDIKLDGAIKIGKDTDFKGAFVTFLENPDYFFVEQTEKYAEDGGWKKLTFYVKPVDSDYLTICLKLGDEDAESIGKAYFDNASMMKVDEVPSGATVTNFKKAAISRYNSNVNGILFITLLAIFTLVVIILAYVLIRRLYSRSNAFDNFNAVENSAKGANFAAHPAFIATMLAIGTGLVNLIFLLTMYGFGSEMSHTVNLARILGQSGAVRSAYATQSALSSTAPGVIYILSIIGFAGAKLDFTAISILIRFINVL